VRGSRSWLARGGGGRGSSLWRHLALTGRPRSRTGISRWTTTVRCPWHQDVLRPAARGEPLRAPALAPVHMGLACASSGTGRAYIGKKDGAFGSRTSDLATWRGPESVVIVGRRRRGQRAASRDASVGKVSRAFTDVESRTGPPWPLAIVQSVRKAPRGARRPAGVHRSSGPPSYIVEHCRHRSEVERSCRASDTAGRTPRNLADGEPAHDYELR